MRHPALFENINILKLLSFVIKTIFFPIARLPLRTVHESIKQ